MKAKDLNGNHLGGYVKTFGGVYGPLKTIVQGEGYTRLRADRVGIGIVSSDQEIVFVPVWLTGGAA